MMMSLFKFKLFKFVSLPTGKFPVSNGFFESICPFLSGQHVFFLYVLRLESSRSKNERRINIEKALPMVVEVSATIMTVRIVDESRDEG